MNETDLQVSEDLNKGVSAQGNGVVFNAVKSGVYLVLALVFVAGVFFYERSLTYGEEKLHKAPVEIDLLSENEIPDNGIIRFYNMFEQSALSEFEVLYQENYEYVFNLIRGRLWGNFKLNDSSVNINVGNIVLIPKYARFDLIFEDGKLELSVFDGDVYVGFLPSGVSMAQFYDRYDGVFLNVLVVPRETVLKLTVAKVNESFQNLLFDKLIKVMDLYAAISSSMKQDLWIMQNLESDIRFFEEIKQLIKSEFSKFDHSSGVGVKNILFWADSNLIFTDLKRNQKVFERLFSYLNEAIYYASLGEKAKSEDSLLKFEEYLNDVKVEETEFFKKELNSYLVKLSVFKPDEPQYSVYSYFIRRDIVNNKDLIYALSALWRDVYSSLDLSGDYAKASLRRFYEHFEIAEKFIADKPYYELYLNFLNHLFDNLFLRFDVFYEEYFFQIKNMMETRILELSPSGQVLQEYKQAFINRKIDFLRRAWNHLKAEKVSLSEVQKIYGLLLAEIKELMVFEDGADTAVLDVFKRQLKSIEDYWGYINDGTYSGSAFYGSTHEQRFNTYLSAREVIPNIEEVFDEEGAGETVEQVADRIISILAGARIVQVQLGEITSTAQRFVDFTGNAEGYLISAQYDRYNNTLNSIVSNEKIISERAVKFASLLPLLDSKFAELSESEPVGLEEAVETHAQRVARNFLFEKIKNAGFVLTLEQIKSVRDKVSVYRISEAYIEENKNVIVTFDFILSSESAENLFLIVEGKPVLLTGPFSLEELAMMIGAEADFSALVKEEQIALKDSEETNDADNLE